MEEDVLSRWRWGRLRHLRLGLLPATLLLSYDAHLSAACAEQTVTSVAPIEVRSLTRDPWPLAVSATKSETDIVITITARFPNDCVAQAGFDPIYRDLAPLRLTGTRLLLLRGRAAPEGCPEIYAPVDRRLVMRMPSTDEVRNIALLDEVSGQRLVVVSVAPSLGDAPSTSGNSEPVLVRRAGLLLPLAAAWVTAGPALHADIAMPPGCSSQDIAIEIIEGRSITASGNEVMPVPLWVFVLTDRKAACQADTTAARATNMIASLQSLFLQGRELRLVNPLLAPGVSEPKLFSFLVQGEAR